MNRLKDYMCFAACFGGLGYMALWPITADDVVGSMVCHGAGPQWLNALCPSALPLHLAPGLHVLGFTAAIFVTARALLRVVKRSRRRAVPLSVVVPLPDVAAPPLRKRSRPLPTIKPRAHFGLRGVPR